MKPSIMLGEEDIPPHPPFSKEEAKSDSTTVAGYCLLGKHNPIKSSEILALSDALHPPTSHLMLQGGSRFSHKFWTQTNGECLLDYASY